MNEVFYSLSIGVVFLAAWLLLDVNGPVVALLGLGATWLIFGGYSRIITLIERLETNRMQRNLRQDSSGAISFAPIDDPVSAHLAKQITATMTLSDIEQLVADNTQKHDGVHATAAKVERWR